MLRSIIDWSLRFRLLVVGIAAATLVFGFGQLQNAPVDVLPEYNAPYVEVQTEALGLSAEEVEQLITIPLEADLLNGVAWLDEIRSESVPGLSSIVLTFEPGTDPIRARQMVQERLTQAHALPNVSLPPSMLQPLSSTNRLMMVGLSSDDLSLIDMSVLARWTIRPRLMGVPGVANVAIWGQRERQLQVRVDPERLREEGVSLLQVVETTGNALWFSPLTFLNASTPGTGGFIDTPNQRLGVQHISPITSAAELARVPLELDDPADAADEGAGRRLGDVATVVEDHQPLIGDAIVDGGTGLLLVVEKFPEANTLEVTRGVEEALQALRPGLSGMQIDSTIFRPATFIESAIDNVTLALLIGLVLVAVVLAALLFDWRAALVSIVAIPLSLGAAALVLYLSGATINAMVVAGFVVAIGVVVDDAVVSTSNFMRRLQERREQGGVGSAAALVRDAAVEVRSPLVYASLIVLLAVVPLFFIGGAVGALVQPLAIAYGVALLASMLVSVTVTPALALLLMSGTGPRRESPAVRWAHRAYSDLLGRIGRGAPASLIVAAVAVGVIALIGASLAPRLDDSLVPSFKERDLVIHWEGAPGTSHREMTRIAGKATDELRSIPGVRNVGAHVGRAIASDQVVGINSGELWVSINAAADYDATLAAIEDVVQGYPGLRREVSIYPVERITEALAGPAQDMVVRVYGHDMDVLRGKAEEVRQALSGINGVVGASMEPQIDEPTIEVRVDLAAAEAYGIKPGDVRRASATLLSGIQVGSLFEEQKVFDVVVWGAPELRNSISDVEGLLIETPTNGLIRLGDVADVQIAPSPTVIKREGVARRIDVGFDVSGRDPGSVAQDVERAIAGIEFPIEYHAEVLGDYAERQADQNRLIAVAVAVLLVIFLLLQAAFSSWRLAFLVLLALPASLLGGVVAALATGGLMTLGALVGLLTVLGITARNVILLIARYQYLERYEGETGAALIVRGARERLVPTLITAVATALAVAPFVVLGEIAGYEIAHPMAIVILGGLVTSTLLNLFIVPSLYLHSGPTLEPDTDISTPQVVERPGLSPA